MENNPTENKTTFKKQIELIGAILSNEQKKRIFQIAEKCPVQKLLINSIEISTELK